jgi:predicted nucleic acid-binding protein
MSLIYWDTMLFAYWLEGNAEFGPRVKAIRETMLHRGDRLCTSVFTMGETLAGPRKKSQTEIADRILQYFRSDELDVLPFLASTAEAYSRIRAEHPVLPADAIHLATASEARVDLFLTNDHKLLKLHVSGIHFISGLEEKII